MRRTLKSAARMLWKSPGVTAVAVAALALGVGTDAAVSSVVNTALLRALSYQEPEHLVRLMLSLSQ